LGLDKNIIEGFFYSFFLGVNVTFFPIHFTGLRGAPRKYLQIAYRYIILRAVSTLGATCSIFALCLFISAVLECFMSFRVVIFELTLVRAPRSFKVGYHRMSGGVTHFVKD